MFLSEPTFTRTLENTTVHGCTYKSAKNVDFSSSAYVTMGSDVFKLNSTTSLISGQIVSTVNGTSSFTLPDLTFNEFVKNGSFRCLIRVGEENFLSNSSVLYESPGK